MASNMDMVRATVSAIQLSQGGMQMATIGEVFAWSELMERAGWLPKGVTKEGAVIAIVAGLPLGFNAFTSVQSITPINGRPSIWGDAMVGVVKASGLMTDEYFEEIPGKDGSLHGYKYVCQRKGYPRPTEGVFTITDAKQAKLWGKQGPWTDYPKRMLKVRARAYALRDAFPDVLKGLRIAEEEMDVVDAVGVVQTYPAALPTPAETPVKAKKRATAAAIVEAAEAPAELPAADTKPVEMPIAAAPEAATVQTDFLA